jgi:hypothetical protein
VIALAGLLVGGVVSGREAALEDAAAAIVMNATTVLTPPTLVRGHPALSAGRHQRQRVHRPFGPPALTPLTPRVFPVAGYCEIPSTALAVSANLTVTQPVAAGWVSISPESGAQPSPLVASITYAQGQTISNAVVAPRGTNGGITLYSKVGTHIVIDVNGYYRRLSPAMTTSCKLVVSVYWCLNPDACGQACNDACGSLGLEVLASAADWFAAQDTVAECQAISNCVGPRLGGPGGQLGIRVPGGRVGSAYSARRPRRAALLLDVSFMPLGAPDQHGRTGLAMLRHEQAFDLPPASEGRRAAPDWTSSTAARQCRKKTEGRFRGPRRNRHECW